MNYTAYLARIESMVDKVEDWALLPDKPIVSVWMITFNHEAHIQQALDSILMQQTTFPYEIIIGEDKSVDQTRRIVEDYQRCHPDKIRIRLARENLYSQKLKPGIGVLRACRGTYVAMLEGDDYWTDPLKLQRQVDFLEANLDCTLSFHAVNILDDSTKQFTRVSRPPGTKQIYSIHDLLKPEAGSIIRLSSVVLRAGVITKYPDWTTKHSVGDYPLYLLYAHFGNFGYLDKAMSVYRISTSGVWSTKYKEPDYAERHVLSTIWMLNEYNKYTNYIYNDAIRIKIKWRWYKFINMYTSQETRRVGKTFFWKYKKHLQLSQQSNLFFKLYFPRLYQLSHRLYNSWIS